MLKKYIKLGILTSLIMVLSINHIMNNMSFSQELVGESLISDYHDEVQDKGLSLMLKPLKLETQHFQLPYTTPPQIL